MPQVQSPTSAPVSLTRSTPLQISSSRIRAPTARTVTSVTPLTSTLTKPASTMPQVSISLPMKPHHLPTRKITIPGPIRAPNPKPTVFIPNSCSPVLRARIVPAAMSNPGKLCLPTQKPAGLPRVPWHHQTRGNSSMRPILQYNKVTSQIRPQAGIPIKYRLVAPPNVKPTVGSSSSPRLSRSAHTGLSVNAQVANRGHSRPSLSVSSSKLKLEHDIRPLPSILSTSETCVTASQQGSPQVWAEAGLVANSRESHRVEETSFVKGEVLEVEQLLDFVNGNYLVKWVGLSKEQSTWEAASSLNCAQLIHQFHTSK